MAGSWCVAQTLALCVWFCAFCHAVPKWSNLHQSPQALMFQQTDPRFQQQASQQFPQSVQASQQFPLSVQRQASQQFSKPVQQQTSQRFLQSVQQQASQQFPQQFPQSVQWQANQQYPKPVQQQASQQFSKPVQQQASQQFSKPVQQQASQQFSKPVQQQASQQFPQSVQQQASQQFPQSVQQQASQQFSQSIQQTSQQFPQSVQQQASQQFPQSVQASQPFPQQFQPKQPVGKAEPVDKCAIADYEQIQCGPPGISGAECAAINCCFNGQQCYYGKAVTVQCIRDGQFVVVVARDVTLPRLSLDSVRLLGGDDPACSPVGSTPFFAIYQFPVTACGTSMMEDSGYVVYENRMTSSYEVGIGPLGSITRDSHFELLFQCRYSGTSVEALVVEVNTVPPPPPVAAPGPLRVELRLANGQCVTKGCAEGDEAYTSYYSDADYPVTKVLREPVYVEVHVMERTDPNIVLMLGHCWATSTPSPLSLPQWDLLVDGCPYQDDRYLTTLVPVTGSSGLQFPTHYKRFIVKMFTFVDPSSLAPLQETIFIHCSTAVCHPSSGSCEQSCTRKRRDTPIKTISSGQTVVSSGEVNLVMSI
ncbi:zona pellucida sperm-binding protein 4-like [Pimephales promelas]|uniref:zona pellucida sperm-binding protein 4-like n=1 Tax=Pimephales promelas TaxID=90988 RepID=UPI001955B65B|nr:zona pellucida sperm-binding protein 4-like [Pimephales promelas]